MNVHSAGTTSETAPLYGATGADVYTGKTTYTATLYDSTSNDTLVSTETCTYLKAGGKISYAYGFATTSVKSSGGKDTATLYDGHGSNTFVGKPHTAEMKRTTAGQTITLTHFTTVRAAHSVGSADRKSVSGVDYALTFTGSWV